MVEGPVRSEVRERVAIITIDNPPVNALGAGVPEAISEAVEQATRDPSADAIVLTGAGTTFVAGADINIFKQLKTREQSLERSQAVHARLKRLEDTSKPLVAAIHGHALGGGLELAMACHYRVTIASANVGQPEVHLGIIPGAGGTQRLPRLCGPAVALELCTGGRPIAAHRAHEAGIVDAIVDGELLAGAIAFAKARAAAGERRRTRDLQDRIAHRESGLAACRMIRADLARTARGARAPFAAVDAIEACLTMDFDAGSRQEIELFADCVLSIESNAMRHLFFAEPFSRYRLRIEYRFVGEQAPDAPGWAARNSGVMVHSQAPETMLRDQDFPISIEVQFLGGFSDGKARPTGNVCSPGTRLVYAGAPDASHCIQSTAPTIDGDDRLWKRMR